MRHVLLFLPPDDPNPRKWMVALWTYCAARSYKPAAVVHSWADVFKMWRPGTRVVVAKRDHADWLEVASEQAEPTAANGDAHRRPCRRSEDHR